MYQFERYHISSLKEITIANQPVLTKIQKIHNLYPDYQRLKH